MCGGDTKPILAWGGVGAESISFVCSSPVGHVLRVQSTASVTAVETDNDFLPLFFFFLHSYTV